MRLFSLFHRSRKQREGKTKQGRRPPSTTLDSARHVNSRFRNLETQITTVNICLKKHDDELAQCQALIGQHAEHITALENSQPVAQDTQPAEMTSIGDLCNASTSQTDPTDHLAPKSSPRLDLDRFTEQEKRILAVFFQNRQVPMSYADVARSLHKSAYTVKNQMRQIRYKASLFEQTVGSQCRNLFKLKDDLKVEKCLNRSQPVVSPPSTFPIEQQADSA